MRNKFQLRGATCSTDGDGINAAGVIVGGLSDNAGVEHGYIATRQ